MKFVELIEEDNFNTIETVINGLDESATLTAAMTAIVAANQGASSGVTVDGPTILGVVGSAGLAIIMLSYLFMDSYMFDGWLTHPIKNFKRFMKNKKLRKEIADMLKGFMSRHKDNPEVKKLAVEYVKAKTHKRKEIAAKLESVIGNDPILKQRARFLKVVREMGAE